MRHLLLSILALSGLLSACAPMSGPGSAPALVATRHADFDHDTLALTWQPGFCGQGQCLADQPHAPLIGLHGLWASETHDLIAAHMPVQDWWKRGCDVYLPPADAMPPLSSDTARRLDAATAHVAHSLPTHEWNKHGRCFGYDADHFFVAGLTLRDRFAASPTGQALEQDAGRMIGHDDLLALFARNTGATATRALQLRCGRDSMRRPVLEQLWFTLRPDALDRFPAAASYAPSPDLQDNCPASFLVPGWAE